MALNFDKDGFLIGERRFKELNGNLHNIDITTKEILELISQDLSYQNNTSKNKIYRYDRLHNAYSGIYTSNLTIKKTLEENPNSNKFVSLKDSEKTTISSNKTSKQKQENTKSFKIKKSEKVEPATKLKKLEKKQIARDEKGRFIAQDSQNTENKLDNAIDFLANSVNPDVSGLSPEIDALVELKDTLSPANRAFQAMGKGVMWLFNRKGRRDVFIPLEQSKQHSENKAHQRETRRLYRLILDKLKDKSWLPLLAGLLRGLLSLAGLIPNGVKGLLSKEKRKSKRKQNNKSADIDTPEKKKNTKTRGFLGGVLALPILAEGLAFWELPYWSELDIPEKVKSAGSAIGATAGAIGAGAMALTNPLVGAILAPITTMLGGITGGNVGKIVGEKFEPYFANVSSVLNQSWDTSKLALSSLFTNMQLGLQTGYDNLLVGLVYLKEYSSIYSNALLDQVLSFFGLKSSDIGNAFQYVKSVIEVLPEKSKEFIVGVVQSVTDFFGEIGNTVSSWFNSAVSFITGESSNNSSVTNSSIFSGSGGVISNNGLVAVMGDYKKGDTGSGKGDHYDLRARDKSGNRVDINNYLDRFVTGSGKNLKNVKQTGRYMEQRDGYKHEGVDFGLNGSFSGNIKDRELFIADEYKQQVASVDAYFNKGANGRSGGWVTKIKFKDGVQVSILHQNEEGAKKSAASWQSSTKSAQQQNSNKIAYHDQAYKVTGIKHYKADEISGDKLVTLSNEEKTSGKTQKISKDAYKDFKRMREDFKAQTGLDLSVLSGFRSVNEQQNIINRKKQEGKSDRQIYKLSAPAGYSEHHTGGAIDFSINKSTALDNTGVWADNAKGYLWLKNNAHKYGFTQTFTKGNSQGVAQENWHWVHKSALPMIYRPQNNVSQKSFNLNFNQFSSSLNTPTLQNNPTLPKTPNYSALVKEPVYPKQTTIINKNNTVVVNDRYPVHTSTIGQNYT